MDEAQIILQTWHILGPGEFEVLKKFTEAQAKEIKRLKTANQHWHVRVSQLKNDLEAASKGN